jgi:aminoglycoside phosphotransferase (APT) family kinase protein
LIERLAGWLEAWNRATAAPGILDQKWIEVELLAPARRIAPLLGAGTVYLAWLRELASAHLGRSLPRVAAHNDLTMNNVLLAGDGLPGIIDWEAARADGIPLSDCFYLAVDALTAEGRAGDRAGAFSACFSEVSPESVAVMRRVKSIARAVQLPEAMMPICFHACWIQHAANELEKRPQAPVKSFLGLVERLSLHPAAFIQSVAE